MSAPINVDPADWEYVRNVEEGTQQNGQHLCHEMSPPLTIVDEHGKHTVTRFCTRQISHYGPHVAHNTRSQPVAAWNPDGPVHEH